MACPLLLVGASESVLVITKLWWHCGRDKGMPNGWSVNWENMVREEGRTQRHVEQKACLLAICLCVCVLYRVDSSFARKGLMIQFTIAEESCIALNEIDCEQVIGEAPQCPIQLKIGFVH